MKPHLKESTLLIYKQMNQLLFIMTQKPILKNHWYVIMTVVVFLLRVVMSVEGFLTWIGDVSMLQISLVIFVSILFFSAIQSIIYVIKKTASHKNDQVIEVIITICVYFVVKFVLQSLPFNSITVVIFTCVSFVCIISLGFVFPKIGLRKDGTKLRFNIFFVTYSITFFLMFITFDLVYLILFYAIGVIQLVIFNKKYNFWKNVKFPMRVFSIGASIVVFVFLAILMVFNSFL